MSDKITKKLYDDIHSIMVEAASMPKTEKEKSLAALAHPKDKVTHKDVLVGRGVIAKEEVQGEAEWKMNSHADHAKAKIAYTDFVKKHGTENVKWGSKNKMGVPTIMVRTANQSVKEEKLDELNKDTMYSYKRKSEADQEAQFTKIGKGIRDNDPESANKAGHKFSMRSIGQDRAEKRLAKEDHDIALDEIPLEDIEAFMQTEDYDQLDELSKTTLGSYIKKRSHDVATQGAVTRQFAVNAAKEKEAQGGYKTKSVRDLEGRTDRAFAKGWKYRQNIGKAVDRLTKEEAELTYEDYAMAILTLGGYDSFGDIDKEDMQDVMEAIDNAYYADDVEVFVRAFSQNNQEE